VAGFDAATLVVAKARLAPLVGPLAEALIVGAANASSDIAELYLRLAEHIDSPSERAAFLSSMHEQP
jgi:hypothetical protein